MACIRISCYFFRLIAFHSSYQLKISTLRSMKPCVRSSATSIVRQEPQLPSWKSTYQLSPRENAIHRKMANFLCKIISKNIAMQTLTSQVSKLSLSLSLSLYLFLSLFLSLSLYCYSATNIKSSSTVRCVLDTPCCLLSVKPHLKP